MMLLLLLVVVVVAVRWVIWFGLSTAWDGSGRGMIWARRRRRSGETAREGSDGTAGG